MLAAFALLILLISPLVKESLPQERRTAGPWWKTMSGYGSLLHNKPFLIHICYKGCALGMLFAYVSSAPFILQDHYGLSQTHYGLIIGLNAIFVAAGAMLAMKFHPFMRAARTGAIILAVGTAAQAYALWSIHSLWVFEACAWVMLFGLGLIFTTTNTLAMNEGKQRAGEASALLGLAGYIVGAVVAPLVGLGNVMHSTAIVFVALAALTLFCSHHSFRLPPDLEN